MPDQSDDTQKRWQPIHTHDVPDRFVSSHPKCAWAFRRIEKYGLRSKKTKSAVVVVFNSHSPVSSYSHFAGTLLLKPMSVSFPCQWEHGDRCPVPRFRNEVRRTNARSRLLLFASCFHDEVFCCSMKEGIGSGSIGDDAGEGDRSGHGGSNG